MAGSVITIGDVVAILRAQDQMTPVFKQVSAAARQTKDEVGSAFRTIGQTVSDAGIAVTKLTAPLALMAAASVKLGIDFESSFAGVKKTVEATDREFAEMAQQFRNLAKEIPVNVNELNRLGEAAGALGIPKKEILDFTKVMAQLGVTTNVTSDQAADAIARIQNIFGAAGKDTDRFASTLVALGNAGASTEQDILSMATRIAGAGNVVGLTQGQVLGFASALSSVGIEAEAGGTAISKVFIELAGSVSKGGSALDDFSKVAGMSSAKFAKAFKEDAAGATATFIEGLGRIQKSGGDLFGTLENLGIQEIRMRDALLRSAGAGDLLRKSLDLQAKAWTENNALQEEARKRFETTESRIKLLWNRVQDLGITIFTSLKPAIDAAIAATDRLIPVISSAANLFENMPGFVQLAVLAFGGLVIATGPVLFVLGQLITSLTQVRAAMLLIQGSGAVTSVISAVTSIGRAAATSTVLVYGLSAALGGLLIGGAIALVSHQLNQLNKDLKATANGGRTPTLREGMISQAQATEHAARAAKELKGAWEVTLPALANAATQSNTTTTSTTTFGAALKAARAEIAALSPAVRNDLAMAIRSGAFDMDALKKNVNLSEQALKLYKDQVDRTTKAESDAADKRQRWIDGITQYRQVVLTTIPTLQTYRQTVNGVLMVGEDYSRQLIASQIKVDMFGNAIRVNLVPSLNGMGGALAQNELRLAATISKVTTMNKHLGAVEQVLGGVQTKWAQMAVVAARAIQAVSERLASGDWVGAIVAAGAALVQFIGSLVKSEESAKVSPLRDVFFVAAGGLEVLNPKVQQLTGNLRLVEAIFAARTVEQYNKAIKDLNDLFDFQIKAMETLDATAKKYNITIEEMGPAWQRQELDKKAQELFKDYEVLIAGGLEHVLVLNKMADSTNNYVQQALKMGMEVPTAMKPMLEAMVQQGLLTDAAGNKITDLEASGISFAMTMSEGFKSLISEVQKLTDMIARSLGTAIRNIPDVDVDVDVHGKYHPPKGGLPDGSYNDTIPQDSFAGGTPNLGFMDFGAGRTVRLHGEEAVIPKSKAGMLGLAGKVVVMLDGREIAHAMVPHLPGAVEALA